MGKINVYDKIVMKKGEKEKIWKSKKFIHKSPSIRRLWNGIYSLLYCELMPEGAQVHHLLHVTHIATLRAGHF